MNTTSLSCLAGTSATRWTCTQRCRELARLSEVVT